MLVLVAVFFLTSGVSVITGSTSIVTVPVMFHLGLDPRVAVATNMFALTFMSIGGAIPFLQNNVINLRRLPALIALTLVGSAAGAMLLVILRPEMISVMVSAAILGVAFFSTVYRQSGVDASAEPTRAREITGYLATLLLGLYGGLFSGGYVTILTAVFIATFRMTFLEAIATTKLINIFSSGVATAIFMSRGLVNYRLAAILSFTMFAGALLGARYARRLSNLWLRRIYLAAVWLLGLKTLFVDLFGHRSAPGALPTPVPPK